MNSLKSLILIFVILLTLGEVLAKTPSISQNSIIAPKEKPFCSNRTFAMPPVSSPNQKIVKHHKPLPKGLACIKIFDFPNLTRANSKFNAHHEIDCTRSATTQVKMNQCSEQKAQHSTHQLTQFLAKLHDILSNDNELWQKLEALNQEWEQFREQSCVWEKTFFGYGSVAPMVYYNCITFYNSQRLERLKRILCENYKMTHYCEL